MTFGEKLKELRAAGGLTQAQLAEASGVPLGTVRDYEQNKRDPLLSTAQRLARGLGVSLDIFPPLEDGRDEEPVKQRRGRPPRALPVPPAPPAAGDLERVVPPANGKAPTGKAGRKPKGE
jgi:transcriptional regulator with XRE-family HTH domain